MGLMRVDNTGGITLSATISEAWSEGNEVVWELGMLAVVLPNDTTSNR